MSQLRKIVEKVWNENEERLGRNFRVWNQTSLTKVCDKNSCRRQINTWEGVARLEIENCELVDQKTWSKKHGGFRRTRLK